ncbi:MAG UNVERIFIED_CONTAM: hypothetical protein LVR18_25640 [Planctomycetaceae bacterium]
MVRTSRKSENSGNNVFMYRAIRSANTCNNSATTSRLPNCTSSTACVPPCDCGLLLAPVEGLDKEAQQLQHAVGQIRQRALAQATACEYAQALQTLQEIPEGSGRRLLPHGSSQ